MGSNPIDYGGAAADNDFNDLVVRVTIGAATVYYDTVFPPTAIANDVVITDVDSTQMKAATVTMNTNYVGDVFYLDADKYTLNAQGHFIDVNTGADTGVHVVSGTFNTVGVQNFSISGFADKATYENILEAFMVDNVSSNASTGVRSFNMTVTDDTGVASNLPVATIDFELKTYDKTLNDASINGGLLDGRVTGGSNALYGFEGNDTLYAGDHGDKLVGGKGADTIYLGQGEDRIVFEAPSDSSNTALGSAGRDTIYNFSEGNDKLDVSKITSIDGVHDLTISFNGSVTTPVTTVSHAGTGLSFDLIGDHRNLTGDDFIFSGA